MRSLVVVCGASGCGKSTVGEYIAASKGLVFLEGDNFHPQENRDKMHSNIPLTDDDRAGWLQALSAAGIEALSTNTMVVLSCSALKYKYRQVFRDAVKKANAVEHTATVIADAEQIQVDFIFLYMEQTKARKLVRARAASTGHFMPPDLVASQYDILELPDEKEPDCHMFNCNVGVEEVKEGTLKVLDGLLVHSNVGVEEIKDGTLRVSESEILLEQSNVGVAIKDGTLKVLDSLVAQA